MIYIIIILITLQYIVAINTVTVFVNKTVNLLSYKV